jgi:hypothetical protein
VSRRTKTQWKFFGTISGKRESFLAKTNEIDPRFHQALLIAFSQRQLGDYRTETDLQQVDIDRLMSQAKDFLAIAKDWLQNIPK